jgi:hypothetical protein
LQPLLPPGELRFLQSGDGRLHLVEVLLLVHGVGDLDDFTVEADEEADAPGHAQHRHLCGVGGADLAVGIGDEREAQLVCVGKFLMARRLTMAHADDGHGHVVRLQIPEPVAEPACFARAAAGEILWVKVKQHAYFMLRSRKTSQG